MIGDQARLLFASHRNATSLYDFVFAKLSPLHARYRCRSFWNLLLAIVLSSFTLPLAVSRVGLDSDSDCSCYIACNNARFTLLRTSLSFAFPLFSLLSHSRIYSSVFCRSSSITLCSFPCFFIYSVVCHGSEQAFSPSLSPNPYYRSR
jgi:hypothetical protein